MPYLSIIQVITAILLVIAILLQSRGSGLGLAFGGDGNVYRTKRGMEKTLHLATIILSIIFLGIALANLFFKA
ncbi:MAG: preprotein translocase subunit SecG [bacterium]